MNKTNLRFRKNITLEQALSGGNFFIQLENEKKVKVNINPGVSDGQIIRLKDANQITDSGYRGDVLIELKVLDHPLYKLNGLDLHAELILTPAEAFLGCSKKMPGPDGNKLIVKVPSKSKKGDLVIVENAGITKSDKIGNIRFELLIDDLNSLDSIFEDSPKPNSNSSLN